MFKATSAILLLSLALCSTAEPLRQRFVPRRGLARQEEAPPSPTPTGYPAAGVTPEVPFELPSSTAKPELTYLPPDNTYGPPDAVYGPPASADDAALEPEQEQEPQSEVEEEQEPEPDQAPIETDDIPAAEDETLDQAKLQPEVEDEEVLLAEDGTVIAISTSLDQPQPQPSARLYQRFPQARGRARQPVPQRLILARRLSRNLRQK